MSEVSIYFNFWSSVWQPFLNFFNDWMIYFGWGGYQAPDLFEHMSCPQDPYLSSLIDLNVEMGFHGNAITNATLATYEKTALQYGSYVSGLPNQEELSSPLEKLVSSSLRQNKRDISLFIHPDKVPSRDKEAADKLMALKNALFDEVKKKVDNAGYNGLKIEQTPKVKELLDLSKLSGEIWPIVCEDVKLDVPEDRKNAWPFSVLEKRLSDSSKKEVLEYLFKKGISIDTKNPEGKTVLMAAIERGESDEVIEFLLEKKPDLTLLDKNKVSALMAGIQKGISLQIIEKLIDKNNVNQASYENTPFGMALGQGKPKLAKLLLKKGADPKQYVSYDQQPLIQFLNNPRLLDNTLLQQLLEKGVDPKNAEYQTGKSLLAIAINENMSIKTILDLIEAGAKPSGTSANGEPVLVSALKVPGYEKVALKLVKAGADHLGVDVKTGESALEIIANKALARNVQGTIWQEIIQAVLDKGGSLHQVFKSGDNILNVLTRLGWPDAMLCQAIKQGADVNNRGVKGDYPFLTFLEKHGLEDSEALDCFLDKDIDVSVESGGKAVVDILLDELEKSNEKKSSGILGFVKKTFSRTKTTSLEKIQKILMKMQGKVLDAQDYGRLILKSAELSLDEKFVGDLVLANQNINHKSADGLTIPMILMQQEYGEDIITQALKGFSAKSLPNFGPEFLKTLIKLMASNQEKYSGALLSQAFETPGVTLGAPEDALEFLKLGLEADLSNEFIVRLMKNLPQDALAEEVDLFSKFSQEQKDNWLNLSANVYFEAKSAWLVSGKQIAAHQLKNFLSLMEILLKSGANPNDVSINDKSLVDTLITSKMVDLLPDAYWSKHPNWNTPDENGNTILSKSIREGADEALLEKLLSLGASVQSVETSVIDSVLETAASKALKHGDENSVWKKIIQEVLDKEGASNAVFDSGDNILNVLTRLGWPDTMLCQAIKQGADVNNRGSKGDYPFLTFLEKNGLKDSVALDCFVEANVDVTVTEKGKSVVEFLLNELERQEEVSSSSSWTVSGVFSGSESKPVEKIKKLLSKMRGHIHENQDCGRLILKSVELSLDEDLVEELVVANNNKGYQNAEGVSIPLALLRGKYAESVVMKSLEGVDVKAVNALELLQLGVEARLSYELLGKFVKSLPQDALKGAPSIFTSCSPAEKEKWLKLMADAYFESKESWVMSEARLTSAQLGNVISLVEQLLNAGANPNVILSNGKTLAEMLVSSNKSNILPDNYWVSHPNWKIPDENGDTLLLKSIKNDASEHFIEKLIDLGVDVQVKDKEKNSALLWLVSKGYSDRLINKFISKGAQFGVQETVYYYRDGLFAALGLFCGAALLHSFLTKNNDGWKPIHYAAKYNGEESLKNLIKKGNSINALTKGGETPLAIAIKNNNIDAINFLINEGAIADTTLREKQGPHKGWSLMDFACHFQNPTAIKYLVMIGSKELEKPLDLPTKTLLSSFQNHARERSEPVVERLMLDGLETEKQGVLLR